MAIAELRLDISGFIPLTFLMVDYSGSKYTIFLAEFKALCLFDTLVLKSLRRTLVHL